MVVNTIVLDPEWLFPLFFDSYYYEIFNGGDSSNIIIETTDETPKNEMIQQFSVSPNNSLVYAFPINRHSKSVIKFNCSNFSTACIVAQVNIAQTNIAQASPKKSQKNVVVPFNEISKIMIEKYLKFLRKEENSVEEGRWGEPKTDINGNILYIVAIFDSKGNVVRSKTTTIKDEIVIFEEEDASGNTIPVEYKPLYRRSKAHPTGNYPFILDLDKQKVQKYVEITPGNVVKSMWHLHQDFKGINTIAYGHLIKPNEIKSNKIQIAENEYVTDWINKGLTDEEAFKLLTFDFLIHQKEVKDIIEAPRWNILPDNYKITLVEISYNGGGVRKFPKMCTAMGIPPTKGNITWFWPSVKDFKLGPVDNVSVKKELNRPDVLTRDANFKSLFL